MINETTTKPRARQLPRTKQWCFKWINATDPQIVCTRERDLCKAITIAYKARLHFSMADRSAKLQMLYEALSDIWTETHPGPLTLMNAMLEEKRVRLVDEILGDGQGWDDLPITQGIKSAAHDEYFESVNTPISSATVEQAMQMSYGLPVVEQIPGRMSIEFIGIDDSGKASVVWAYRQPYNLPRKSHYISPPEKKGE